MKTAASMPFIATRRAFSRRQFLRGAGVALGLPLLDAMAPAFARGTRPAPPRRFFGICNNLGLLPDKFFPSGAGHDYTLSPYLSHLAGNRDRFTVFSGVSHPDVDNGHPADVCFLTAAPRPGSGGFRNSISLDQYAAEQIGHLTRYPSLTLGVNVRQGARSLSWTGTGVLIPCEESAAQVFRRLFLDGSPEEVATRQRKLQLGESIMDTVAGQLTGLKRQVGERDRERLEQYFTGVRDLERRLELNREWEGKPKPRVDAAEPEDPKDPADYMKKVELMYDLARLAFETDSTRMITLMLDSAGSPAIEVEGKAVSDGYHNLSHHGKRPEKLAQLERIDVCHMKLLNRLIDSLAAVPEDQETLIDRTMVLYGSNMGDANTHVTSNLPVIFAGGGFKHGQHLAFDTRRNYPLPNLYVSMLQRLGIETDQFASSTGTMRGLELA
jgi:hypothetical protein